MGSLNKIGVFGHYGNKNLGDEAIILAVIQNIESYLPGATVVCYSIDPDDSAVRYGVESHPIRLRSNNPVEASLPAAEATQDVIQTTSEEKQNLKERSGVRDSLKRIAVIRICGRFLLSLPTGTKKLISEMTFLKDSLKHLRSLDLLMVTGSNQFLDNFGGSLGFPYTLLKWSVLARITKTPLVYVSVGAGPLSRRSSCILIKLALKLSEYVSLRDLSSQKMIHELVGYQGKTEVYPDLAHSLNIKEIRPRKITWMGEEGDKPMVGINPMPLYDPRYWCEQDDSKYLLYVEKMVNFTSRLISHDFPFFLFATQEKDNNVIDDILDALNSRGLLTHPHDKYILKSTTVDELMANIATADITVATRFHGTVLSLLSEKPMLGVCYYRKAKELLEAMGQKNYAVDLDTFTVDELWEKFLVLVENMDQEIDKIKVKNKQYIDDLTLQYKKIFHV